MRRFPSQRSVDRLTALNTAARVDLCDVLRQDFIIFQGVQIPADPENLWPVFDTDVPVRIETTVRTATERQEVESVTSRATFRARFEVGYDIKNTDRIRGKSGGITGRVFQMLGPDFGSNEVARIMLAEEVV